MTIRLMALSTLSIIATFASLAAAGDAKTAPGSICDIISGDFTLNAYRDFRFIMSHEDDAQASCPLIRDNVVDPMTDVWVRVYDVGTIDISCNACSINWNSLPAIYDCSESEVTTAAGANSLHIETDGLDEYDNGQYGVHCHYFDDGDRLMSLKWEDQ